MRMVQKFKCYLRPLRGKSKDRLPFTYEVFSHPSSNPADIRHNWFRVCYNESESCDCLQISLSQPRSSHKEDISDNIIDSPDMSAFTVMSISFTWTAWRWMSWIARDCFHSKSTWGNISIVFNFGNPPESTTIQNLISMEKNHHTQIAPLQTPDHWTISSISTLTVRRALPT